MVGAVTLFCVFLLVFLLLSEGFTVLFQLTGLTRDKEKFQVTSLLTNSGFTTGESELITTSPIRRRLARITMVFGYAFTVTIVSTLVNVFLAMKQAELTSILKALPVAAFSFVLLTLLWKLRWFRGRFDHWLQRAGNRLMFGKESNPIVLVDQYGNLAVAEVQLERVSPFLAGKPLSETGLREQHGISVMLVQKGEENGSAPEPDTVLAAGNTVLIFGDYKVIRTVFEKVPEEKGETRE